MSTSKPVIAHYTIDQIPPELLLLIFQCSNSTHDPTNSAYTRHFIRIASVCAYWRQIMLTCHSAWAYLTNAELDLAQLLLQRSNKASLFVKYEVTSVHDLRRFLGLWNILDSFARLESFHIQAPGKAIGDILSKIECTIVHLSQRLCLDQDDPLNIAQNKSEFLTAPPYSRSLSLRSLSSATGACAGHVALRFLHIENSLPALSSIYPRDFARFLLALSSSLEEICISRIFGMSSSAHFNSLKEGKEHPVPLPRLKHLTIEETHENTAALLHSVYIPTNAHLHFHIDVDCLPHIRHSLTSAVLPWWRRCVASLASPPEFVFIPDFGSTITCRFDIAGATNSHADAANSCYSLLIISIIDAPWESLSEAATGFNSLHEILIESRAQHHIMQNSTSVVLHAYRSIWRTILSALPELRVLTFVDFNASTPVSLSILEPRIVHDFMAHLETIQFMRLSFMAGNLHTFRNSITAAMEQQTQNMPKVLFIDCHGPDTFI
jgi:hypothetical protein